MTPTDVQVFALTARVAVAEARIDALERSGTRSTSGPGLRDGIRERPSTWPPDSGDPVESRNLPAAPPEVGDDPAGSDGSTATRAPAVGTGESAGPTSADGIGRATVVVGEVKSNDVWLAREVVGTIYGTPVVISDDVPEGLIAYAGVSGAHAPDPIDDTTTELADDDTVTYRYTGEGAYDIVLNRAEGPAVVLAMVHFTKGTRGWRHALERLTASLGSVSQDVQS